MRNSTVIGRIAALAAVAIAIVAVAYIVLFSGGSNYKVYAIFQDASQIVTGDQVQVGGTPIGSIPSDHADAQRPGQARARHLELELCPAARRGRSRRSATRR